MKKSYLDFLYERRGVVIGEIEILVEKDRLPRDGSCEGCGNETKAAIEAKRNHLLDINKSIETYMLIHK